MDGRLMVERINQVPAYVNLFNEVYADIPSYGKVLNAIAAYIFSLNSPLSAYDDFLAGNTNALSVEAQAGLSLFSGKAECSACHSNSILTDGQFYNTGVATDEAMFNDPERYITFRRFFRTLGFPNYRNLREDPGQYALTLDEADWGKIFAR